ncbi:MAG: FecR family protein [Sphingomonas sp.]|uniref:FecR family protein n=1 Tax=Sphingomonas sp. TaxID=28214 RepID=UPI003F7FF39C
MRTEQGDVIAEAINWQLRLAAADERQWAEFIAWLEASPAHAAAYDKIAITDRLARDARFPDATPVADNDNGVSRRWRWVAGGGLALAAVAALFASQMMMRPAPTYVVATANGERRTIALGDGTRIEMSGGTTLRLERDDPRTAMLDQGEAVFHVRHDAAHPFTMTAGGMTIRDLGTVFNVTHVGNGLNVEVSEGAVLFEPKRNAVRLDAGDALSVESAGGRIVRSTVAPALVGGWRSGMVSFDGERIGSVVATLRRLYAFDIRVEGDLSERPFTGMIRFTGAADRDIPHLADLIGATWRRDGERWILSGATTASR